MEHQSYERYQSTNVHSQHGLQDTPTQFFTAADPI